MDVRPMEGVVIGEGSMRDGGLNMLNHPPPGRAYAPPGQRDWAKGVTYGIESAQEEWVLFRDSFRKYARTHQIR